MQKMWFLSACMVMLSGCASVFTGTNQSIHVRATDQDQKPLNNVSCKLTDNTGAAYNVTATPGAVIVPKGNAPLQIRCVQAGYQPYSGAILSSFNPVTLLDVFFWPTFIVDFATGAAMKYPAHYNVDMNPKE